jgi:hypothetical protein
VENVIFFLSWHLRYTDDRQLFFFVPATFKAFKIFYIHRNFCGKYLSSKITELSFWVPQFLKYSLKLQGGMHLATRDAHLLSYIYYFNRLYNELICYFFLELTF